MSPHPFSPANRPHSAPSPESPLTGSRLYRLLCRISWLMDRCYLDPILGFIFPGIGDVLPALAALPFLYLALFRLRSVPLALAVLLNALTDILFGLIPFGIGGVIDLFNRSYIRNLSLIDGYIRKDPRTLSSVRRKAGISIVLIIAVLILIVVLIHWLWTLMSWGWTALMSLFG